MNPVHFVVVGGVPIPCQVLVVNLLDRLSQLQDDMYRVFCFCALKWRLEMVVGKKAKMPNQLAQS